MIIEENTKKDIFLCIRVSLMQIYWARTDAVEVKLGDSVLFTLTPRDVQCMTDELRLQIAG